MEKKSFSSTDYWMISSLYNYTWGIVLKNGFPNTANVDEIGPIIRN